MCQTDKVKYTKQTMYSWKRNICDTCLIALYKLEIRATLDNVSGKTDTKMPLSKSKVMVKLNSCGLFNNISFFFIKIHTRKEIIKPSKYKKKLKTFEKSHTFFSAYLFVYFFFKYFIKFMFTGIKQHFLPEDVMLKTG